MATVDGMFDLLDGDRFGLFESGNSDNEGLGALSYLSRGASVTEVAAGCHQRPFFGERFFAQPGPL